MRHQWTSGDEALLRGLYSDLTIRVSEIGDRLGVSAKAVERKADSLGLRRGGHPPARPTGPREWTADRDEILRSGWSGDVGTAELAAELGVTPNALGLRASFLGVKRGDPAGFRGAEVTADFIEAGTDPYGEIAVAAGKLGQKAHRKAMLRFLERLRGGGAADLISRAKKVRSDELLSLLETNARDVLASVDSFDLENASLKDKAIAVGIFLEKRALLKGEPTQILRMEERQNLQELMPRLVAEMARRGMTVELTAGDWREVGAAPEARVLAPSEVQEAAVNQTLRRMNSRKAKRG